MTEPSTRPRPADLREAQFVEAFSTLLEFQGLQRMAGRVFAWLLICTPAEQSSGQLAEVLHASRGAISTAISLLLQAGLVQRVRRRGDRNLYVEVPPGALGRALEANVRYLTASRELLEHGIGLLADAPPERRARLQEGRDIYAFFEQEYPKLLLRYMAASAGPAALPAEPPPPPAPFPPGALTDPVEPT
jgi:predicted transcriptional regulator